MKKIPRSKIKKGKLVAINSLHTGPLYVVDRMKDGIVYLLIRNHDGKKSLAGTVDWKLIQEPTEMQIDFENWRLANKF